MGGNASTEGSEGAPAGTPAPASEPAAAPAPAAPKEEAKKEATPTPPAETKEATPAPTEEKKEEAAAEPKSEAKASKQKKGKEKGEGKASKGKGKDKSSEGKPKAWKEKSVESTKGKGKEGKEGKEGKGKELFSGPTGSGDGFRLNVKYMSEETTEEQLKELFAPFGTILSAAVKKKDDGKSRGIGNVVMSTEEEAKKAMEEMNGKEINGKKLSVVPAERRPTEEGKAEGKGDKGKGKGKGKGGKPTEQEYQMMYQQQQMYQWQMYQQQMYQQQWMMYQQQAQQSDGKASTTAGGEVDTAKEYEGSLKSIRKNGYGFILCKEINDIFYKDTDADKQRDIYIDKELIPEGAVEKDRILFTVKLEERDKGKEKVERLKATSAKLIPRSSYEVAK